MVRDKVARLFDSLERRPPLAKNVVIALVLWIVLLPFWALFGIMGTGMAGEGRGIEPNIVAALLSSLSYPVLIVVAFISRRKKSAIVWLPVFGLLATLLFLMSH